MPYIKLLIALAGLSFLVACGGSATPANNNAGEMTDGDNTEVIIRAVIIAVAIIRAVAETVAETLAVAEEMPQIARPARFMPIALRTTPLPCVYAKPCV